MSSDHNYGITRRRMLGIAASVAVTGLAGSAFAQDSSQPDVTGIIGAMPSEIAAFERAMEDVQVTTVSGIDFIEGAIDGNRVVVAQCGMGKVNAAICAQTAINRFGAVRVINTGVAGALTSELTINDFVVSTDAVQHDYDVSPIGFQRGEVPYTGLIAFAADEQLRAKALEAVKSAAPSSKVLEGRVCTGDQFIETDGQKEAITSTFGGLCSEMEGAAIAQVCYLNNVPFVIIRAISDDGNGTSYEQFQEKAAQECASAVIKMVQGF